jgi:hypothetical protein
VAAITAYAKSWKRIGADERPDLCRKSLNVRSAARACRLAEQFAQIDGSGFESYRLSCRACAVPLAGVVDPYDETLLLSELKE